MRAELVIVGAGPAGLALATAAALRGISTVVLERQRLPIDKACGEGVMPAGLRVLEWLGASALLRPEDAAPIHGIRYVREDGVAAEGRLPAPGGLGIRRLALSRVLGERARQAGVTLLEHTQVTGVVRESGRARVIHRDGEVDAALVVAADGLHSPLRDAMGLSLPQPGATRRFGIRRHFRLAPWSELVEVHLGPGVEAYLTPAGRERVGVAMLWEPGAQKDSFESLLAHFPALQARVMDAPFDSESRGAGPFLQTVRARTADRFALLGDAAGYVDAITGEGISLALVCAWTLASILPDALRTGATRESLASYERIAAREFRRYAWTTHGLLALARRKRLRSWVVGTLATRPRIFEALLGWVMSEERLRHLPRTAAPRP